MQLFSHKKELTKILAAYSKNGKTIGFVPTMGALHEGHLSLLEQSIKHNDYTVISIFVNPTQFNNSEDLKKYPRTLESDIKKINNVSNAILIYAPQESDIYGGKTSSDSFDFDGLELEMEGKHRPGHFDGVGTVVKKLFDIVKPHKAYFGEKDFQQLQIVKKLVKNQKIPVEIIGCPIHRESNGLAMSSRNERLTNEGRMIAGAIYNGLLEVKKMFGTKSATNLSKWINHYFKKYPKLELEYFEIADEATLKTCKRKSKQKKYRAFIAVFVDNVRLIDNISLN